MSKHRWLARDDIAWLETELGFGISTDDVALVRMTDGTIHTKRLGHHAKHKEWAEFLLCPPETMWDKILDEPPEPDDDLGLLDDVEPNKGDVDPNDVAMANAFWDEMAKIL